MSAEQGEYAVATFRSMIDGLDEQADTLLGTLTGDALAGLLADDAVALLKRLREVTTVLGYVDEALVRHAYLRGEHNTREVAGVGQVTVARSRERKQWRHAEAAHDVVEAAIVARDGETLDPMEVVRIITDAAGFSYWRVTALRAAGLDPEDYAHSEPGKPTVRFA